MKKSDIKEVSTSRRKYLKDIRLKKIKIIFTQVMIVVVLIGLWEMMARLGKIDNFITSQPSRIVKTFANLSSNNLLEHLK